MRRCVAALFFLLSSLRTRGVEITKCCPSGQVLHSLTNHCQNRSEETDDNQIFSKFPPKIFSLEAEDYVNETFVVRGTSIPSCGPGERMTRETGDSFVILSEERTLFLPSDTSTHSHYCLEEVAGPAGETMALLCTADPTQQCSDSVCVSSCCPESMLVQDLALGECQFKEEYQLIPPFKPGARPDDFLMVYGEPDCDVHIYNQEEFLVREDGWLEISHHALNITQYCIEEVQQGSDTTLVAKVCYQGNDEHRARLDVISRKLTPALLIISEIFLLLTFVLHVIVPEFRKQMFGWMKMCTVAALFLGYQMLIIAILGGEELQQSYSALCQALGLSIQYFFLAAFCWMSSMSGEVWTTFRQLGGSNHRQRTQTRRFYYFNLYSWGLPALLCLVTLSIHLLGSSHDLITPGLGANTCFFSGDIQKLLYLHGIIAAVLVINMGFFIATAYNLLFGVWAPSADGDNRRYEKTRQMLGVVLELFMVMGLTWVADVISTFINWRRGEAYFGWEIVIFDIINSLQGLFIFLVLICKQKMREKIRASLISQLRWCVRLRGKGEMDTTDTTRVVYTVSPRTKTSHAPSHSCVSTTTPVRQTEKISSWRNSSLLDRFTPAWKRGSYNVAYIHSQEILEVPDITNRNIKTVSCDGNFGNESKC